jgi:hypothetical protein
MITPPLSLQANADEVIELRSIFAALHESAFGA